MSTHRLALSPRAFVLYTLALLLILTILATAQASASSPSERPAAAATPGGPSANMLQTPTPTCASFAFISGSIGNTDPTMPSPLVSDGSPSSCAAPNTCPGPAPASVRHYETFSRQNMSSSEICYQVQVDPVGCPGNLFVAAYAGQNSFNPTNVCLNYLADIGTAPNPSGMFEVRVPGNSWFTLVAYENAPNVGCSSYALELTSCTLPPATPTPTNTPQPTPTGTPPTPIITATGAFTPPPITPSPSPTPTLTPTRPPAGIYLPAFFRNAFSP